MDGKKPSVISTTSLKEIKNSLGEYESKAKNEFSNSFFTQKGSKTITIDLNQFLDTDVVEYDTNTINSMGNESLDNKKISVEIIDDKITTTKEYANGHKVYIDDQDRVVKELDSEGNIVKDVEYMNLSDTIFISVDKINKTKSYYKDNQKIYTQNEDGTVIEKFTYEKGHLVASEEYDENGNLVSTTKCEYDEKQNKTEKKYDANGNITTETKYTANNEKLSSYNYEDKSTTYYIDNKKAQTIDENGKILEVYKYTPEDELDSVNRPQYDTTVLYDKEGRINE